MKTNQVTTLPTHRQQEIVDQYLATLDQHILELCTGQSDQAMEIRDFAQLLHLHPNHLSNTIKEVTGQSSCSFYEERLLAASKALLQDRSKSIGQVAVQLTYDPSNFTKFFKQYTGMTPKQYREQLFADSNP